jgi:hypothetical protein
MPKLKRIIPRKFPQKVNMNSLRKIYGNAKGLKFYSARGGHIFAVGIGKTPQENLRRVIVSKLSPEKGAFELFAAAELRILPQDVRINVAKTTSRLSDVKPDVFLTIPEGEYSDHTGFNILRLIVNEAATMARQRGGDNVILRSRNPQTREYEERLGFVFGEGEYGTLELGKKPPLRH